MLSARLLPSRKFVAASFVVACGLGLGWIGLSADGATELKANPQRGAAIFSRGFNPAQGLGPLFNGSSCVSCHNTPSPGGMGPDGLSTVLRVGKLSPTGFDAMSGHGGPVARAHSIAELGVSCPLAPGIPAGADLTSVRNAPALFGDKQLDAIPDEAIQAGAVPRLDGVHGHPNIVAGRVGRFGWKADTPTLTQFVGEAFRNEMGLTNPIAPLDLVPPGVCSDQSKTPKIDLSVVNDVVAYIDSLPEPVSIASDPTVFDQVGCSACHVPSLGGVPLYSDLLLHDMGPALDDAVTQATAAGHDWRTTPLWGLSQRTRFLHDGRAKTLEAAIVAHGGEASAAVDRYRQLSNADHAKLIAFLGTR